MIKNLKSLNLEYRKRQRLLKIRPEGTYKKYYLQINAAIKDLGVCLLLTFIGINLKIFTENFLSALIFCNIVQTGNPDNRYDIYSPSPPDIGGDLLSILYFAVAYLFLNSQRIRKVLKNEYIGEDVRMIHAIRYLKDCLFWTKNYFLLTVIGFGLYFFSKYALSIGIEVINLYLKKNAISDTFKLTNNIILFGYSFIFVYLYCRYLSTNTPIAISLYIFFLARNLFATNVFELVTNYDIDIHVGAPFLDWLSIIILIYSCVCVIKKYNAMYPFRAVK